MMYIEIEKGYKIPTGNFNFLYDVSWDEEITLKFRDAEGSFWIDYHEFASKLRKAYEEVAVYIDMCYLKANGKTRGLDDRQLKKEVMKLLNSPTSKLNIGAKRDLPYSYKNVIIRYVSGKSSSFTRFLANYDFCLEADMEENLTQYIRYIYDFGSKHIHKNESLEVKFLANEANCRRVLRSFHDFLAILFHVEHRFSFETVPVGQYVKIPGKICLELGLDLDERSDLYASSVMGKVRYYLGIPGNIRSSLKDRRENEAIRILWEEGIDDPANVIRACELIEFPDTDSQLQIYSLPGFPVSMTQKLVEDLRPGEKQAMVTAIAKGVNSLHSSEPKIAHRRLCPQAFLLFRKGNGYRVQLADFRYAKRDDDRSNQTVIRDLQKEARDETANEYFAPEFHDTRNSGQKKDWSKADIYSLGQLWMFIETGMPVLYPSDIYYRLNLMNIPVKQKDILELMLSTYEEDRPEIGEVLRVLDV